MGTCLHLEVDEIALLERFGVRARRICGPFPIWLLGPGGAVDSRLAAILSPLEIGRAARFREEALRDRYIAAHGALRLLGEALFGIPAHRQTYGAGPHGKPYMRELPRARCSISYSGRFAAAGWSSADEIGLDIEVVRPIPDARDLAETYFTERENSQLAKFDPVSIEFARSFLTIWVRKEACSKALGAGFSIAPASYECGAGQSGATIEICGQRVSADVLDIEGILLCWAKADQPGR